MEPLTVTMRTPGDDFDLVAGFLHAEAVVSTPDQLVEMTYCRGGDAQDYNVVEARLAPGVVPDRVIGVSDWAAAAIAATATSAKAIAAMARKSPPSASSNCRPGSRSG